MPVTKEVVADTASSGARVNRNPYKVSRTGVNGSTPGNNGHAVSVEHVPSPVMIGVVGTYPPGGLNRILQVAIKRKSTSPDLVGNTQKLDAVVGENFPNDLDSASIFRKVIGPKLSDGSRNDLYLQCMMNFVDDVVQTQAPQFMNMGLSTINTLG